jgi:hypothetical protein
VITAHAQKIYGIDYSRKRKDSIVTCSLDSTVKVRRATDTRYAKAECYHSTGLSMALPK